MAAIHQIDDVLSYGMNYIARGHGRHLGNILRRRPKGLDAESVERLRKLAQDLEVIEDRIKAEFYIHRSFMAKAKR